MPRAYTKSGSIEKYECAQWSTPTWSGGATGSVTGPDSNGNYTVNAPSDYSTTVTSFTTATCTTNYAGVTTTFTFYSTKFIAGDYIMKYYADVETVYKTVNNIQETRYNVLVYIKLNRAIPQSITVYVEGLVKFTYIPNNSSYRINDQQQFNIKQFIIPQNTSGIYSKVVCDIPGPTAKCELLNPYDIITSISFR